jgi:hypothetical protein
VPCGAGGQPLLPDAERWGENRLGTSPARHACWQTPAPLREVLAFRRALPATPGGPWRLRGTTAGGAALAAERGPVRLLVHDPAWGGRLSEALAEPRGSAVTRAVPAGAARHPPAFHRRRRTTPRPAYSYRRGDR